MAPAATLRLPLYKSSTTMPDARAHWRAVTGQAAAARLLSSSTYGRERRAGSRDRRRRRRPTRTSPRRNSAARLPLTAPPARRSHCRRAIVPTAASRRCLCHGGSRESALFLKARSSRGRVRYRISGGAGARSRCCSRGEPGVSRSIKAAARRPSAAFAPSGLRIVQGDPVAPPGAARLLSAWHSNSAAASARTIAWSPLQSPALPAPCDESDRRRPLRGKWAGPLDAGRSLASGHRPVGALSLDGLLLTPPPSVKTGFELARLDGRIAPIPLLSTSGETLTIEESMNLEGENGERRICRSRARMELRLGSIWCRRPRRPARRSRAGIRGRRARPPSELFPEQELVEQAKRRSFTAEYKAEDPRPGRLVHQAG